MQITTKHQQLQPIQPILQLVKQVVSTNASQGLVFTTNLAYFFGQIQKRAKKLVIQVVCTNASQGVVFTTDLTYFLVKSKKRQITELQDRIKLLLSQVMFKKNNFTILVHLQPNYFKKQCFSHHHQPTGTSNHFPKKVGKVNQRPQQQQ